MPTAEQTLEEFRQKILELLPKDVSITSIDFEGPQIVIYTEEPQKFAENEELVRSIAKELKKRIAVRPSPEKLMEPERAVKYIYEIIPEDSGIRDIHFDFDACEVVIEAEKPGLVIGRRGATLRDITKRIGWRVNVIRAPPIQSTTIKNIRQFLRAEGNFRREFLKRVGKHIFREKLSSDEWVRVTMLGGCREVGRSAFLLSTPETRILIDCGVNVSSDGEMPYLYVPEVQPLDQLDAVVITHAHLDHSGLLPLLFKYGYDGPVYVTPPTRDLMVLLQLDYLEVSVREGRRPPYKSQMIREALRHTIPLNYGDVTDIAPDVKLTFFNAGHILGSAVAHFHIGSGLYNVVFTGDIKYERTLLFDPAVNEFSRVEALVIEGTYGGSNDFQPSRREAERRLQEVVKRTLSRGGKVIIPAFAVGRSQEVMIVLEESIRNGIIDEVPVYLDGMIWEATAIHTAYPEYLNKNLRNMIFHKGLNPFLSDIFVQVDDADKRKDVIESSEPSIILATSGMLNGGPVIEYLKGLASDERNTLIFVGYQAEGTLGRRIQRGWKEIQFSTGEGKTEVVKINMEVVTVDGFSGHSDRGQLIEYVRRMKPQPSKVICVHGEGSKCIELASAIHKKFGIDTRAPMNLETIRLI